MNPIQLYLVRHGETIWNQEKRMQGQKNSPLTASGRQQARLLGEKLKGEDFTACFTSPSPRVLETFALMEEHLTVTPVQQPDLQEIKMGRWEGHLQATIAQQAPQEWDHFWHHPELFQGNNRGETFAELKTRCDNFLELLTTEKISGKVLVVSHRLTIRTLINTLLKQDLAELKHLDDIEPNSLTLLTWDGTTATVEAYSDTSHYTVTS